MKGLTKTVLALVVVVAAGDSCSKYAAWGRESLEGCKKCQKYFPQPGGVDKCMGCGKQCWLKVCQGKPTKECVTSADFTECDQKCLKEDDDGHTGVCKKYEKWGPEAMKGCRGCMKYSPAQAGVDKCMGCGKMCWMTTCQGKSIENCIKSNDFLACDKKCLKDGGDADADKKKQDTSEDPKDCYFDAECHKLVDWNKITKIKKDFFARLLMMKRLGGARRVHKLMKKVHVMFVEAGMPENRVDYILSKWVMYAYPEALSPSAEMEPDEMEFVVI